VTDAVVVVRRAAQHRVMPWANGGGITREVVAVPDTGDWTWRLSIADVTSDGPFSQFPGVQRTIALLQGQGFELRVDDAMPVAITQPYEPFRFDGAAFTECQLVDGPVVDLNLMERGLRRSLDLRFVELAAGSTSELAGALAVLLVSGRATVGAETLDEFDALVTTQPGSLRARSGSQGAVLAVVGPTN
jgi:environmental stress-induced protein Ves